jgi:DnaJ-class molecular chaperone
MSRSPSRVTDKKAVPMDFGKRAAVQDIRSASVMQQTCERCYGTGWVRERGSKIGCKPCKGTGRVTATTERDS